MRRFGTTAWHSSGIDRLSDSIHSRFDRVLDKTRKHA